MILGAGIYQVPLIRTARRMGLYTIVVSIPGDYPGFALADKIYELNTRDKEAILAAAEKEQIDGICTSGTDVAKGMVAGADGQWIYFDMVPEEYEVRDGAPEFTGRICVIGSKLAEDKLAELFGL